LVGTVTGAPNSGTVTVTGSETSTSANPSDGWNGQSFSVTPSTNSSSVDVSVIPTASQTVYTLTATGTGTNADGSTATLASTATVTVNLICSATLASTPHAISIAPYPSCAVTCDSANGFSWNGSSCVSSACNGNTPTKPDPQKFNNPQCGRWACLQGSSEDPTYMSPANLAAEMTAYCQANGYSSYSGYTGDQYDQGSSATYGAWNGSTFYEEVSGGCSHCGPLTSITCQGSQQNQCGVTYTPPTAQTFINPECDGLPCLYGSEKDASYATQLPGTMTAFCQAQGYSGYTGVSGFFDAGNSISYGDWNGSAFVLAVTGHCEHCGPVTSVTCQ
jgi:hypothetical protein